MTEEAGIEQMFPEVKVVEFSTPNDAQLAKKLCREIVNFSVRKIVGEIRAEAEGWSKSAAPFQEGGLMKSAMLGKADLLEALAARLEKEYGL